MSQDGDLTEREREVLALLLQGHETKSIAASLGISVHAVNERLREARRKLGASSSREAARRYFQGDGPAQISRDRKIGIGGAGASGVGMVAPAPGNRQTRLILIALGVAVMLSLFALAAALSSAGQTPKPVEPAVVATTPGAGSAVAPGPFTLSVTFDRPMIAGNYSFVQVSAETFPKCEKGVQMSADRRTFSMNCAAEAGRHYEVWFNRPPYTAFQSEDGTTARPHRLLFEGKR